MGRRAYQHADEGRTSYPRQTKGDQVMRSILMSTVSFTMEHVNGTAKLIVPVWFLFAYAAASLVWPTIAVWALVRG